MELWIRSQDKGVLTKANNLVVLSNNIDYTSFSIKNYEQDDSTNLGFYKSKERALEVLDEIQKILKPTFITHEPIKYGEHRETIDTTPPIKVYEMPKE